jgi:hypothetical protein
VLDGKGLWDYAGIVEAVSNLNAAVQAEGKGDRAVLFRITSFIG